MVSKTMQGKEYHPPISLAVVAIEKGAFGSPSTKVRQLTIKYYYYSQTTDCHILRRWTNNKNLVDI